MDDPATPPSVPISTPAVDRLGLLFGIGAYSIWGFLPIYFKLLKVIPSIAIVANRICWSLALLVVIVTAARGWPAVRTALRSRRTMLMLATSATLIAINWLVYIFAINSGHILAGSLGYYLNPLANILLGRFVLKETLSRTQWTAVAIAAVGIGVMAAGALDQLWISLVLCMSFALYGLVRKVVAADALTGLGIETAFLAPLALIYLSVTHVPGTPVLAPTAHLGWLLAFSGVVTSVPLLLFSAGARRLPLSTLGMLQFLAPTLQLLCAVFLFGEAFTRTHAVAFAAIWGALVIYAAALIAAARRERLSAAAPVAMMR